MGLEFYVLNHVLYLVISPPIDNGPGGALEAKPNQRQPLAMAGLPWCEAILMASSAIVEAPQPPGQWERVDMQDAVVLALL